jgi:hypothetical protein
MPTGRGDNSDDNSALSGFVAQLEAARTIPEMEAILRDSLAKLGLKYFAYHVIRANEMGGNRLPHLITTYPRTWVQHYFSSQYLEEDPIVNQALRSRLSFFWSDVSQPEILSLRQKQLMDEARDAGVASGLTIPMTGVVRTSPRSTSFQINQTPTAK